MYAITALMESKKGNTTNAVGEINSDKQGWYQVVWKWLTTNIVAWGGSSVDTSKPGVYHVWGEIIVTDGNNTYTLMDKNLWASEAGTGDASYGWYFQWWNNFGFANAGTLSPSSTSPVYTVWLDTYTSNVWIYDPSYSSPNWDRWNMPNNDLRPEGGQWPCPQGYHVPTKVEREWVIGTWENIYSGDARYGEEKWGLLTDTILLPRAGQRDYGSASLIYSQGDAANYWSSTTRFDGANMIFFYSSSSSIVPDNYARANGFSVRCFKNSPL